MCDMAQGDVENKLGGIDEKLDQLLVAVHGDERYGSRGIGPRLKAVEDRISDLEQWRNRVVWMAIGAGLLTGMIGRTIVDFISSLVGG